MTKTATILIVDDEEGIRHGLTRLFEGEGYAVAGAEDVAQAEKIASAKKIDIAILDVRLKGSSSGLDLLARLKSEDSDLPVIIITGYGSIESAIEAMKRGASDYILKPVDNEALLALVRRNLEVAQLKRDNRYLKRELLQNTYQRQIITKNPEILNIMAKLDSVKDSTASILITGESGTGKEVFARYIHFTSARSAGPFVSINCAALSEELLLSELFGHEKGAFTGAIERKIGKFELADKGTLFLDEIGDMSPTIQAKLLRVLEENSFERVGGTKRISVDIRVVAATNHDIHELIRTGKFRSDLYYRIAIVEIKLPPLRERVEDIPYLAEFFINMYAERYKKHIDGISPEVMQIWLSYRWPGNIRELQNVIHQAVLLCTGNRIEADTLLNCGDERARTPPEAGPEAPHASEAGTGTFEPARYPSLKELGEAAAAYYERQRIESALAKANGNKSSAARALGITRKTLLEKLRRYGIC
ncbi:MAG: sigma-54-dependent transcriptional regulator [Rectinema subterraneum]|uniref:sigma-54-dependent transcriptional regulator n=1 Tax=Rectinema subterraneum TaxID=2653714 RepID=UPI003C7C5B83